VAAMGGDNGSGVVHIGSSLRCVHFVGNNEYPAGVNPAFGDCKSGIKKL